VHRRQQSLALVVGEARQRGVGREPGPVQDVVGVAPAHTGHRALVAQDRVDAPGVVARADDVGELVGARLGAQALQRPRVAGSQDPPARLALRAELLDEHARAPGESQPHDTVLGSSRLGRILHVDPTALGEVHEQARALLPGELEDQVLAAMADRRERMAHEHLGRGVIGLQRGELEGGGAFEGSGGQDAVESLGQGLHLRRLGHGPTLPERPLWPIRRQGVIVEGGNEHLAQ
jgi:hypothetical protein